MNNLKKDAQKRMKQWRKENGETSDGIIVFIIIMSVAIIIGNAVLMWVY